MSRCDRHIAARVLQAGVDEKLLRHQSYDGRPVLPGFESAVGRESRRGETVDLNIHSYALHNYIFNVFLKGIIVPLWQYLLALFSMYAIGYPVVNSAVTEFPHN